jgi:hypothetical protein
MADKLLIEGDKVVLTTDEGVTIERPASDLADMFHRELLPPLGGTALPDGTKFVEWRDPFLLVVHQLPWQVRRLRWIANDSPVEFGEGTTYRKVRLSLPYAITFAVYFCRNGQMYLSDANELYFRNSPLTSKADRIGYPGLLNISRIPAGKREKAWICTQYLRRTPEMSWTQQLNLLLEHTWNGGFNRSSEHHEGASWYKLCAGIHNELHPVEAWEAATAKNEAFGVSVPWKESPLSVGELMDAIFEEQKSNPFAAQHMGIAVPRAGSIVSRFMNFAQNGSAKPAAAKESKAAMLKKLLAAKK